MSLITVPIPSQNFELVLDRIGSILKDELDRQSVLKYDPKLSIPIFKERHVPFNDSELPTLNVMLETGDYMLQDQTSTQGTYVYIIEGMTKSKTRAQESGDKLKDYRGDTRAMVLLQKIMGLVRAILEDPQYKTLGFAAPSIGHRSVSRMYFMKQINQDAENVMIGRVIFTVKVHETVALKDAPIFAGNTTRVKLDMTDEGYQWVFTA